tara:strand:+ start:38 stop:619 length:582 start_codon:yes stop_codon:yes gene_type:complete
MNTNIDTQTLRDYHFEKIYKSPDLWKNEIGIEKGINLFRYNVIEMFIDMNKYNLRESFDLFESVTMFFDIETKEDFQFSFLHLYDELGECNYFDDEPYNENLEGCYKSTISEMWNDGIYKYKDVKRALKRLMICDCEHIDGLIDNILHASGDFIDYLPSEKALKKYDTSKMNLIDENCIERRFSKELKQNESI